MADVGANQYTFHLETTSVSVCLSIYRCVWVSARMYVLACTNICNQLPMTCCMTTTRSHLSTEMINPLCHLKDICMITLNVMCYWEGSIRSLSSSRSYNQMVTHLWSWWRPFCKNWMRRQNSIILQWHNHKEVDG